MPSIFDTLLGASRRTIHRPHRHLTRRWDWYARWHDHPASDRTHGTIVVGALFVSSALLLQVTTLQSNIVPSTPTVEPPAVERPAGRADGNRDPDRPEQVRRTCGDRTIITDTIGTERNPVRFKSPVHRGRWTLTLSVVRRSAALGATSKPGSGSTIAAVRVRDEDIDCPDVRRLSPELPVSVDLSGIRIDPDCERCSLDGVRPYNGNAELGDHEGLVVATGDERAYGQWALSGIRVSQTVPAKAPQPSAGDTDTWVVLTLASI